MIGLLNGTNTSNARRLDLLPLVEHCQRPILYGGGKKAGRLWNDYLSYFKTHPKINPVQFSQLTALVSRALRPAAKWRQVAHHCIAQQNNSSTSFAALHARMEVDMLTHLCGQGMQRNLTKLFHHIDLFLPQETPLFVAVSRQGMLQPTADESIAHQAQQNVQTFQNRLRTTSTFECGETFLQQYYPHHARMYGSLLPSILNFYIATQASVFVGVQNSTWSKDVWTARFYLDKPNYEYTTEGIQPVLGLPKSHKNC